MRLIASVLLVLASQSFGGELKTTPPGATIFVDGKNIGKANQGLTLKEDDWNGEVLVALPGYKAKLLNKADVEAEVILADFDHTTSTGLPMVTVPILDQGGAAIYKVQFAIWETRIIDYKEFAKHVRKNADLFSSKVIRTETDAAYERYYAIHGKNVQAGGSYPVSYTSRETEFAFCDWLTERDRSRGLIGENMTYRLPSDLEWSAAALINESRDPDLSPNRRERTAKVAAFYTEKSYPEYPVGNLMGSESIGGESSDIGSLDVSDGFAGIAPVGQFAPNGLGIFDLLGNLYEECLDLNYDDSEITSMEQKEHYVSRGPSYKRFNPNIAVRYSWLGEECGFRIILVSTDIVPFGYHGERPTRSYTKLVEQYGSGKPATQSRQAKD
jgi:Sulfatase-modifying factor enzyme 1